MRVHSVALIKPRIVRKIAQVGDTVVKPLQIGLVSLLPCRSRVGIAVSARECSSVAHSVLHCHSALLQIPVLIHLVHGVGIKVILKRVAVEYLVKQSLYLVAVFANIVGGL